MFIQVWMNVYMCSYVLFDVFQVDLAQFLVQARVGSCVGVGDMQATVTVLLKHG